MSMSASISRAGMPTDSPPFLSLRSAAARRANRAGPIRGVIPVLAYRRNRQSSCFSPAVQFERRARGKIGAMIGLNFITCPHDVVGVFDDFARFGFLTALEVGVAQEVHGMSLIVRFRLVHFRGMRASGIGGNI